MKGELVEEETKEVITKEQLKTILNEFSFAFKFINEYESKFFIYTYEEYQLLSCISTEILREWKKYEYANRDTSKGKR